MALKCKIASESDCGKDCCCYDCKDAKTCEDTCPTYEKFGKKVLKECEELIQVEETEIMMLDEKMPESIKILTDIMQQKKRIEETEKTIREKLLIVMEEHGIKSFENEVIKLTYIAPTERKSIDSTRLKKEHPEIAEAYQKVSQVKSCVKIEIK